MKIKGHYKPHLQDKEPNHIQMIKQQSNFAQNIPLIHYFIHFIFTCYNLELEARLTEW